MNVLICLVSSADKIAIGNTTLGSFGYNMLMYFYSVTNVTTTVSSSSSTTSIACQLLARSQSAHGVVLYQLKAVACSDQTAEEGRI